MRETFNSVIRIFVEGTETEAKVLAKDFTNLFNQPVLNLDIEKYYKFPNWYEISFQIEQVNKTPNQALEEVGKILGTGWEYTFTDTDDDFSSYGVWNPNTNSTFVNDSVKFANLETFLPNQENIPEEEFLALD